MTAVAAVAASRRNCRRGLPMRRKCASPSLLRNGKSPICFVFLVAFSMCKLFKRVGNNRLL